MQEHAFFIALAYGVSVAGICFELIFLFLRNRQARRDAMGAFEFTERS